jgi:hypothetical protein
VKQERMLELLVNYLIIKNTKKILSRLLKTFVSRTENAARPKAPAILMGLRRGVPRPFKT